MTPRVTVDVVRLDAAAAELLVHAEVDDTGGVVLRGRLMGPRCPGVSTVEVAYPLKPLPADPHRPGRVSARVVIPDPNLWEPAHPFVYWGPVEVWRGGEKIGEATE